MPKDKGANVFKVMRETKCEPKIYTQLDVVQGKSRRGGDTLKHE